MLLCRAKTETNYYDGVFIKNDKQVDEYVQRVRHTTVTVSVFTGNSNSTYVILHMKYFSAVRSLGRFNL